MKLDINHILYTKDGREIGNAIVIHNEGYGADGEIVYIIKTDYGNECTLNESELCKLFYTERGKKSVSTPEIDKIYREIFPHKHSV
jgi:hypothetical protein